MTGSDRPTSHGTLSRARDLTTMLVVAVAILGFAQQANSIATHPTAGLPHTGRSGPGISHGDSNKVAAIGSS